MIDEKEVEEFEHRAIRLLQENQPRGFYYGCFSGGKDSSVIKHLCEKAGVRIRWYYNVTTIDPPEIVRFIRNYHKDVIFVRPPHGNFFNRMVKIGFPTRRNRWCCREYKESIYPLSTSVMGIRSEESVNRSKRWGEVSQHYVTGLNVICPIYEWASDELWFYIKKENIPYCSLYDDGFKRLGCIGCPNGRKRIRIKQFERWPKYKEKWMKAFSNIWDLRSYKLTRSKDIWFGNKYFDCSEDMFYWWLSDDPLPERKIFDDEFIL